MTLWKVRIEFFPVGVTHPQIRRFLVDAESPAAAFQAAEKLAEKSHPGLSWTTFKERAAVQVTLPLEL
jgi:hypothetical protein